MHHQRRQQLRPNAVWTRAPLSQRVFSCREQERRGKGCIHDVAIATQTAGQRRELKDGGAEAPELLERDLELEGLVRARTKRRLPVVMTIEEMRAVLYGGGLRLMEALRMRVHDVNVQRRQITVRQGKGGQDRRTMLPARVAEKLRLHLEVVRRLHRQDLAEGYGRVSLPHALARKVPRAAVEWGWPWVFPQHHHWHNADTGEQGRHHLDPSLIQKAVRRAVLASGIVTPATCHTFRHS